MDCEVRFPVRHLVPLKCLGMDIFFPQWLQGSWRRELTAEVLAEGGKQAGGVSGKIRDEFQSAQPLVEGTAGCK